MMKSITGSGKIILLAVALVFLVGGPVFGDERFEEKFTRTEPLAADGRVSLSNIAGDIEIGVWKENQVKIDAVKISRAATLEKAKENAAKVTIEVRQEAGRLIIETKYPKKGGFWGDDSINVSVDYKLLVPARAAVEVKSVSGDVDLKALGGRARVESVSGDIEVLGAAGLTANLVSGDADLQNITGDVEIKTVSGDLRINGVKGSVEAESVSGDVKILENVEAKKVSAKSISGDITYEGFIYEGGRYDFRSHSGDAVISIPAGSSFDFETKTFSGAIDSDFEIQVVGKISQRELKGTVGKGGAVIRASSFSGNIELKKSGK